ncbi:hypothetical protein BS78_08G063000 [Paspalum vaginatum]|nr:hypothetical protein BS78_08G063000 [Paspalum vaginatum]
MRLGVPKHGQYSRTQSTQNTQNLQPAGRNVPTQLQTLQEVPIPPYSGSVGASTYHNGRASEDAYIINPYLAPYDGKPPLAAGYVSKQSTYHSRDPRFVTMSSAASPPIQTIQQEAVINQPAIPVPTGQRVSMFKFGFDPSVGHPVPLAHSFEMTDNAANSVADPAPPPVLPIEQGEVMIQPAISASSGQQIHTVKVAFDPGDGHPIILSHSVELPVHAANLVVNSSESTKGEPRGSDVGVREPHDDKKAKARIMFRTSLKKFVREQIKKTWGGDPLKEELSGIVQKIIENVMRSEKNIPTEEKISGYLRSNRMKIKKLIQVTGIVLPITLF